MTTLPADPHEFRKAVFAWAAERGIKTVRLIIYQPRVNDGPIEYQMPLRELEAFAEDLHRGIEKCSRADAAFDKMPREEWNKMFLHPDPSNDTCRWCKALPTCPAVQQKLQAAAQADFHAIVEEAAAIAPPNYTTVDLSEAMAVVPLMESWCKGVRAELERRLLAGEEDSRWGFELGRRGARAWSDPEKVETLLKSKFRMSRELTHNFSMKSPTQLEELTREGKDEQGNSLKAPIGPRQWKQLQEMIVQPDGKPSVKPLNVIKKPYIVQKPTAEGFTPVEEPEDDLAG